MTKNLNLDKIESVAESHSSQELFAALVWQRGFNQFNGKEVITDLSRHPELWEAFIFAKPIFKTNERGLNFGGTIKTLISMSNYRPMPESSIIQYVAFPADTIYILARNEDTVASKLLEWGKKWRADWVDVVDSASEMYGWQLRGRLSSKTEGLQDEDAVVVCLWWD